MLESPNRQMPHSTDADTSDSWGRCCSMKRFCEDVKLRLQPDDFYHHRHRIIYETMLTLLEQNIGVDVTTVTAYLQDHKRIAEVGGVEYILTIYESVATTAHTDHYIEMVLEKSVSRLIITELKV